MRVVIDHVLTVSFECCVFAVYSMSLMVDKLALVTAARGDQSDLPYCSHVSLFVS